MKDLTTQSHAPHITNDSSPVRQGYKWTEVGVIPEDWDIQRLDAICSVYSGGTPSTARHDFYGGHIPWITSGDLNARRITEVSNYLTQAGFDSSAAKMVESGDIVVALYGATAGVVAITEIEAAINQAVLAVRTNRCNSEYLFHHLESRRNQIVATYTQGGQPNLSGEIIRSLVIVIPPPVEQRAIAEVLSDVDGLLNALNALITKKRAIKRATMQQLLTGKTRLPGFSGEWKRGILADFGVFQSGNGFPLAFQGHQSGDYPFFKVSDLSSEENQLFMNRANHYISENIRRKLGAIRFEPRSIVFAKIGAAIFLERKRLLSQESCLDNNMMAFTLTHEFACPRFFYYIFLRIELGKLVSTTALPALSSRHIEAISILIPPLAEQHAIAAVLSDMDAEIMALEQRRDKTRAIKQGMMQQLLTGRVWLSEPAARG